MAKQDPMHKGAGPYQERDASFLRRVPENWQDNRDNASRDVSRNVNKNADENSGAPGAIRYGID